MNKPRKNLLLVGVGPHARHFYLPVLARLGRERGIRLLAAVELKSQEEVARQALRQHAMDAELITVPPFSQEMPSEAKELLDEAVRHLDIEAVIVATDPESHRPYCLWALEQGLDILLDKPITTRQGAVSDLAAARGIEDDYEEILAAWQKARQHSKPVVSICAHRRYHPGIEHVLELLREVCGKTGCPVTDAHAHHADGQWRLPAEMVTQDHHSYHAGHGKASHSGHHFFDCLYRYWQAGLVSGKSADTMRIYASFIQPHGLLHQLTRADYSQLFGESYEQSNPLSDSELDRRFRHYGEVDLNASITFLDQGVAIGQGSLNLLHNSFSRRSWLEPAQDLYKGNGRVKHEEHRVHVGPFLAAYIHSYQAKDDHKSSDRDDRAPGGNNHFEIAVFRNTGMIGGKKVEIIPLGELDDFDDSRLFIDQVKEGVVTEFLDYLVGSLPEERLRSPLVDHAIPVRMLSAVYESQIRASNGDNPTVEKSLDLLEVSR